MPERLKEFFAVTMTSLYRVSEERGDNGAPTVEKLVRRDDSEIGVGGRLKNGHLVGVGRLILLYDEDFSPFSGPRTRPQRPEEVNTRFWGGCTSQIVGLFLKRRDAVACLAAKNRQQLDERWKTKTLETLRAIGDGHPTFIVCRGGGLGIEY